MTQTIRIRWTREQDDTLISLYQTHTDIAIGKIIGRSKNSVNQRRLYLNLRKTAKQRSAIYSASQRNMARGRALPRIKVKINGEAWTIKDIARTHDISANAIRSRLRAGWKGEDLLTPVRSKFKHDIKGVGL